MDDQGKVEEHVEDLELKGEDAEDVKGGFSWGISNLTAPKDEGPEERTGLNFKPSQLGGARGLDGNTNQHNEILVAI
jgi:hypothetical protein